MAEPRKAIEVYISYSTKDKELIIPDEEKKSPPTNGNNLGNTTDPNGTSISDPTTELDEIALFRRLSPSAHQALNEADGIPLFLSVPTYSLSTVSSSKKCGR